MTMQAVEVRRDWFTKRVSIIAGSRSKRPKLIERSASLFEKACPFCLGNEHMTPPAQIIALDTDHGTELKFNGDAASARKWNVRAFPNMFPAFSTDTDAKSTSAYGHHLIVVESPDHARDLDQFTTKEIEMYLQVLLSELSTLNSDPQVNCISIFRNYGEDAGASISHPHTQIVASRMVPPHILHEVGAYRRTWASRGTSAISMLVSEAMKGGRLVLNKKKYVAFVPYAPISPYELWIAPEESSRSIEEGGQLSHLGEILIAVVSAVKRIQGSVAYNLYFHLPPRRTERFHWHIELVPRSNKLGGYELGFGAFIITVSPEDAAQLYRQALQT